MLSQLRLSVTEKKFLIAADTVLYADTRSRFPVEPENQVTKEEFDKRLVNATPDEARGRLANSEIQESLPRLELSLEDARGVQQDHECGEDSEDSDDAWSVSSGDKGSNELEPISKEAIELRARVVRVEWRF